MTEAITARQRAQDRKTVLLEGPNMSAGMLDGPAQVYIGVACDCHPIRFQLYRSPNGRKVVWIDGTYATPAEAILAREELMS